MSSVRGTALTEYQTNITFSFCTIPYIFSISIPQIPKNLKKIQLLSFFKFFKKILIWQHWVLLVACEILAAACGV